jgi:hypothetical protein
MMMSSSKGSQDGPGDCTQDWKVDWLEAWRLLNRQGGATVAKVPAERLGGAVGSPADGIGARRGRSRG